ncbi:hypothetical protein SeMB42_g07010 [Synchytrium endobioticum]|uniref:Uncharacterized protein n=1 Tax=Synchytrium endobioticum TaxID=286115 RepID=A0A507CGT2_9FUNG|nr:hypothetical protein SeMB42_g07010 [Synchytrium endobioticum]TPX40367.1 hypothetical protein SeLEV6574_g06647 [Synchytrium endobioticum]
MMSVKKRHVSCMKYWMLVLVILVFAGKVLKAAPVPMDGADNSSQGENSDNHPQVTDEDVGHADEHSRSEVTTLGGAEIEESLATHDGYESVGENNNGSDDYDDKSVAENDAGSSDDDSSDDDDAESVGENDDASSDDDSDDSTDDMSDDN